jgi:hypothetical protein
MQTISILTPARLRPQNIKRMLESIKATMSGQNNVQVIFRIDNTDEKLNDSEFKFDCYKMINERLFINFIKGPELFPYLGPMWDDCFNVSTGEIVQYAGDDLVYETENWDLKITEAFNKYPDEIVLVWAADGIFGAGLATHGFLSRKWIETVGWVFPPCGMTYANDDAISSIARRLNRSHFIGDVSIKHLWDGGNPNDPNYSRLGGQFERSHNIFGSNECQSILTEAVNKLDQLKKG